MRLLVCGSREWSGSWEQVGEHLPDGDDVTIIHGACSNTHTGKQTSVDMIADFAARSLGHIIEAYPVIHRLDGPWPAAGPKRNARMLRESRPDAGLAFGHLWKEVRNGATHIGFRRTGTGDMSKRLLAAGLPVRWVAGPGVAAVDLTAFPAAPASL